MSAPRLLYDLLKVSDETTSAPILLESMALLAWGRTLVFSGTLGARRFTIRYEDCRELRLRTYVGGSDAEASLPTPLVDFSPGRDQHRSPAQFLTGAFGLTLYYGGVIVAVSGD